MFGATGGTGRYFIPLVLNKGHRAKALVRNPAKLSIHDANLDVTHGSITELADIDRLVEGVDFVVVMLGGVALQRDSKINAAFVKKLIPAMRRHGVTCLLYQAVQGTTDAFAMDHPKHPGARL